jgi:hypothetical protein
MLKNGYTTTLRANTILKITKVTILTDLPTTPIDTIQPKQINLKCFESPPKEKQPLEILLPNPFSK